MLAYLLKKVQNLRFFVGMLLIYECCLSGLLKLSEVFIYVLHYYTNLGVLGLIFCKNKYYILLFYKFVIN